MTRDFAQLAKEQWEARRHRDKTLGAKYAGEGPWDILLYLRAAEGWDRLVSVSEACLASGIPPTTALRSIAGLTADGLIVRVPDQSDRRRAWLELTDLAISKIDRALAPPVKRAGRLQRRGNGSVFICPVDDTPDPTVAAASLLREALTLLHIVELDRRVSRASMNGRGVDLTATDLDLLVSLGLIAMLHTAKTEYLGEQARCRHARHHSIAEANTGSTNSAGKTEQSV
ncbi:MAG: MarR family winged helix-turn-helix transcriptional regulator, partial [Sphingomonas parapaucimobilis]